jgi:type VI secretion system Hcp family effector
MQSRIIAAAAALLAFAWPASAQGHMQVDGVAGESVSETYRDWIDVLTVSEGIESTPVAGSGSARGAGRAVLQPVVVTKAIDTTTPVFRNAVATGRAYKTVTIRFGRLTLKLEDVQVTRASSFSAQDSAVEELVLAPSKATWSVEPVSGDGKLGNPVESTWDAKLGKAN